MRVTVFAPDDLQLVKGGPAGRRDYLDDLLVAISPALRGGPGRLRAGAAAAQRAAAGRAARRRRRQHPRRVRRAARGGRRRARPGPAEAARAAGARGRRRRTPSSRAGARRSPPRTRPSGPSHAGSTGLDGLDQALLDALASQRKAEVDRGLTLVGPHRDEWRLRVGGLESRTHASQGEQRTLALALRLGGHRLSRGADRQRAGAPPRRRVQRARRPARGRARRAPRRRRRPW